MKISKFIFLFSFIFSVLGFAHAIPGINLEVKDLKNNTMLITANFKKSKRPLVGNKIKLISMIDNRVLFEDKLPLKGLITKIPDESYWIYLIVRDNDVVIDGIVPLNGFTKEVKKEPKALLYSLVLSLFFIISASLLMIKRKKELRKR